MNIYHVWFSDIGENKGDKIETFSNFDAAVKYFLKNEEDVLDDAESIFVRSSDNSVREITITLLEDSAYGANGYNSTPPINDPS